MTYRQTPPADPATLEEIRAMAVAAGFPPHKEQHDGKQPQEGTDRSGASERPHQDPRRPAEAQDRAAEAASDTFNYADG